MECTVVECNEGVVVAVVYVMYWSVECCSGGCS